MEVSITDVTDVEKKLEVLARPEDLAPHFEEAYKAYQFKSEIKGFRKGKAPLEMIKKIYGEDIEYNALETIASDIYKKIIEEKDIHPIGEPVLTDIDYKRGQQLTFSVRYEVKPEVVLREYKGIGVEKVVHKVTDKEVEDEILRLRKSNSTLEEAASALDTEHVLTADVQQLDSSGTPLIGRKTADARIYLADESLFPELKEALQNAAAGETRRVIIEHGTGDNKYTEDSEITVKKVEKVILPEFNDEFVGKVTKNKTTSAQDFRKQIREDLENYWRDRSERQLTDTIIAEIVRRHDISVPETLVKGVLASLIDELKNRYPNKKLPADFSEETFRDKNRGYAIFQAKWYLIRDNIIKAEGIKIEDSDLENLAERDAAQVGIEKGRLVEFYRSSDGVKDRILSDKLTAFLKQNEKITEKVTEEFPE